MNKKRTLATQYGSNCRISKKINGADRFCELNCLQSGYTRALIRRPADWVVIVQDFRSNRAGWDGFRVKL